LINHIRESLPSLKRRIEDTISEAQARYEHFGGLYGEHISQAPTLLRLLNQYSTHFVNAIEGNSAQVSTRELCGGASIFFIFDGVFNSALSSVDPFKGLTDQDIRHAVRNANGIRPSMFVHDKAFENLVKMAIQRLFDPCTQCVELVRNELNRITESSGSLELSRYPFLRQQINEAIQKMLKERLKPTHEMVLNLINIEVAYINTSHPDFHAFLEQKKPQQQPNPPPKTKAEVESESPTTSGKGGLFGFFGLGGGRSSNSENSSPSANQPPQDQPSNVIRTPMDQQEQHQIELIKQLIKSYFSIVRKTVQDGVPKAIVYFLIENMKENLNARLIQDLYKEDRLDELLQEDKGVAEERVKCKALLDSLKRASIILSQISENEL